MREKLRQFMIGRYGTDGLNQFLSIASLALLLIAIISRVSLFTYLGAALLIFCYYRTFSRNISKRTEENYKFYTLKDRVDNKFKGWKEQWANRKVYHYYRCPQCRQKLRVPRGRGRIQISCPRCGTQFIKLSHVRICYPESGRTQPGGTGAVPRGLLRALPPHWRAARHPGAADPEL